MTDIKQPNRKTIRGVDWMSQKSFNDMKRDKARAAELGMTYDEFFNESYRLKFMMLKQEITIEEYNKMISELNGKKS